MTPAERILLTASPGVGRCDCRLVRVNRGGYSPRLPECKTPRCGHVHLNAIDRLLDGTEVFECIDCGMEPLDGYGLKLEVGS